MLGYAKGYTRKPIINDQLRALREIDADTQMLALRQRNEARLAAARDSFHGVYREPSNGR
jgi:hypothetical protein